LLSLTGKFLQRLARVCCAHLALTVSWGVVLAVLDVGYAAHSLTLAFTAYAARVAGDLRDGGRGGERRRAVLRTAGAR
jgi:hypothetical protein